MNAVKGSSGIVLANNGDDMLGFGKPQLEGVVSTLVEAGGSDKAVDSAADIVTLQGVSLADLGSLTVDNFLVA